MVRTPHMANLNEFPARFLSFVKSNSPPCIRTLPRKHHHFYKA